MLCPMGSDYKIEPYNAYRNRVLQKHEDKINAQMRQIKDSSLKDVDKAHLKATLLRIIEGTKL